MPTIPCSIKNNYVKTALCDLGGGVSVMPFSLYKRLDLEKLIPTDISLQMADKSTIVPVGICEDVPVQFAHNCMVLTNFVVLEMPEDDNMSIMLEICPRGNNKCIYYYIFVFMINVYIHAIIVLTGNINTCVISKLN